MIFFDGMYAVAGSLLSDRVVHFPSLQAGFGVGGGTPADQSPERARS